MVLVLGLLVSGTGLLFAPLALLCGWIAWPVLWYMAHIVAWCASLPGAYINVSNVDGSLAWVYYGLLALFVTIVVRKQSVSTDTQHAHIPLLSRRTLRIVQLGAALLVILATGAAALASQPDGRLTITFLDVGPAGQPSQGEAILLHTPDGKTVLIDGGLDASSLAQALDSRLPSWQRSLDIVLLTTPRQDHLLGLQDIVKRYSIGEVIDAGMLHPNTTYALWRRTITERNFRYTSVVQGTTISVGTQVVLQVLWPSSHLHKGSDEVRDNGLIIRLVAPGLHMLLLGAAAQSRYALAGLLAEIDVNYLQAEIVQIVGEVGKTFPSELGEVMQKAHPSLLVITPASLNARQRKAGTTIPLLAPPIPSPGAAGWQVVQTAQVGTIEINDSNDAWSMSTA